MRKNNRWKTSILLVLCIIGILFGAVLYPETNTSAQIENANEIKWQEEQKIGSSISWRLGELSAGNYILEFFGTGNINASMNQAITDYKNVTQIIIKDGITGIGEEAFQCFYGLKTVYIADSVKTIGNKSFDQCKRLEAVAMSKNITTIGDSAFSCCFMLEHIDLPKSLQSIGESAFCYCTYLNEALFDLSQCEVGKDAFQFCAEAYPVSTGKIDLQGSCGWKTTWKLQGDKGDYTLTLSGEGLVSTNLPWYEHMTDITHVVIEEGITDLPDNCFLHAFELKTVKLPETLQNISAGCFGDCDKLEEINIPNSVVNIGNSAFFKNIHLKEIVLPASLKTIGDSVFMYCVSVGNLVSNAEGFEEFWVGDKAFLDNLGLDTDAIRKNINMYEFDHVYVFEGCYGINSPEDAYLDPWTESDIVSLEAIIQKLQADFTNKKPRPTPNPTPSEDPEKPEDSPIAKEPETKSTFKPESIQKEKVSQLKANPLNNKSIVLKWNKLAHATSYRIYRSTKEKEAFSLLKTVGENVTEYRDTKLKVDKKYYYQVSAVCQDKITYESIKSISSAKTFALATPTVKLAKNKTLNKIPYLAIKVRKYQGEYMEIYLKKNNGRFKKYFVNKKKLAKSKGNFKFSYKKKDVNIYVQIRTYRKKNGVKKYSGFSEVKSIHL